VCYFPLTFFYLLVFFLKLDINSSQLHGFIIYSQFISIPTLARNLLLTTKSSHIIYCVVQFILAVYGVWNLDFFRSYNNNICFRINSLATLSLDLIVAVYPLLLMLITYTMIELYYRNCKILVFILKPLGKWFSSWHTSFSVRTSLVNSFAAFLFLCNAKLLNINFDILTPVKLFQLHTSGDYNVTWRLYYDPTVRYFSSQHKWYAFAALMITISIVIIPLLTILLYSFRIFQKLLSLLPIRWQLSIHTFMDSFQGCYKDGTEPGMRDCRWYGPMLYFIRIVLMVVYGNTLNGSFFLFGAIILTVFIIFTINVDPFKPHLKHLSSSIVIFLLFINANYVSAIGAVTAGNHNFIVLILTFYIISLILALLPLPFVAFIALRWLLHNSYVKNILTRNTSQ